MGDLVNITDIDKELQKFFQSQIGYIKDNLFEILYKHTPHESIPYLTTQLRDFYNSIILTVVQYFAEDMEKKNRIAQIMLDMIARDLFEYSKRKDVFERAFSLN